MFLTESWFWRGTQSAIFYYVSCAPCVEFKYKQKRRKEALKTEKEKAEIITQQPGRLVQPGPFQTNPDWAEEIIMGPGPPKGWKKDKILRGFTDSMREKYREKALADTPRPPEPFFTGFAKEACGVEDPAELLKSSNSNRTQPSPASGDPQSVVPNSPAKATQGAVAFMDPTSPITDTTSSATPRSSLSDQEERTGNPRPSVDRKLSNVVLNLKDTLMGWNSKRYEREDEVLSGFNERLTKIWDKARSYGLEPSGNGKKKPAANGRKRAATNDSERYDYQRGIRYPEINDMHPPTVSKLPATKEEAAWMLLPPPSAAVMAGKVRPHEEPAQRWPLAIVGRDRSQWEQMRKARELAEQQSPGKTSTESSPNSKKTPVLSNSSTEDEWSDDEENRRHEDINENYTREGNGWFPAVPSATINKLDPSAQHWLEDQPRWQKDVY